jgi:hypothetical protein
MKFPGYPESAARDAVQSLPRLSMEEYVAFVGANAMQCDPEKAKRQKELEENIHVMFSLHPATKQ